MTTDAESRHDLSIALDRWHRNSCHPDATTGDLSVGVDAVLAAIRASGRLAPEVTEAERAVVDAAMAAPWDHEYAPLSQACYRLGDVRALATIAGEKS